LERKFSAVKNREYFFRGSDLEDRTADNLRAIGAAHVGGETVCASRSVGGAMVRRGQRGHTVLHAHLSSRYAAVGRTVPVGRPD
jgi:hypothetical protein